MARQRNPLNKVYPAVCQMTPPAFPQRTSCAGRQYYLLDTDSEKMRWAWTPASH